MSSLFLDHEHKLTFEKVAMAVKLSDSPDAWQREIASEIYKQVPFLGDYAVNVIIDRVDGERGYAFGSAHVTNKSEAPQKDQKQLPSIRIPIIVKERMLTPMDVFMDGDGVYPLTEKRVREKLFRTATFEPSTRKSSDKGMVDQLYPPMRTNYGMGAAGGDGMGKSANDAEKGRQAFITRMKAEATANPTHFGSEKGASLLTAIAHTIPEVEADEFVNHIVGNEALKLAAVKNKSFQKLAFIIANADRTSVEKTASELVSRIKPTVVQIEKLASGNFKFKWANVGAFAPQEGEVDPAQAQQMSGANLGAMQPGETVTVSTEKAKKESLKEEGYAQVDGPGFYKVQSMDTNSELNGYIMPIVDFEQQALELYLFSSPEVYSVQDEIAGVRMGNTPDQASITVVPLEQAQGDGALVYEVNGKWHSLLPMTIQNMSQDPSGMVQISAETLFGEPVTLTPSPGLQSIQQMGDFEYAVPDFVQWHPLQGQPTLLAKQPLDVQQMGQAQAAPQSVQVGSTGQGEFSMDGQPLAKVAKADRQFIKTAQAEFLLVTMGMNPFEAKNLLKTAEERGSITAYGLKTVVPLADVHKDMVKKAAISLENFPYHLRINLVKEAAALEDSETADKVLSLNFLNPENISTFANYLPDLDSASQKLAETLVASRLGMSQVDEGAVARSMRGMESVIEGLKSLQHRESL
jgi:hypothetical protein